MSNASRIQRAFAVLGLVGLIGAVSTSSASAFHFGGGGGFHPSVAHFGGGGGFHPSVAHFGGGGFHPSATHFSGGGRRSFSAGRSSYSSHAGRREGGRQYASHQPHDGGRGHGQGHGYGHDAGNHTSNRDHAGRREHGSPWAKVGSHCWGHHRCGGFGGGYGGGAYPVADGSDYDNGPAPAAVYPTPVYSAPVMKVPAVSTVAPVSAPTKTCDVGGTFVTVVFQPTATAATITAFLKDYDVTLADGPNPDGMYRIKISAEKVSTEQYGEMLDSMRGKKDVVSAITIES